MHIVRFAAVLKRIVSPKYCKLACKGTEGTDEAC